MFYKLHKLSGRLVGSQQLKAMLPQGIRPFIEPQPIFYDSGVKVASVPVQEMKPILKPGEYEYGTVPEALRKNMIHFQQDNGVPVHFKGGNKDYVLLGATLILLAVGLFESLRFIYVSSYPSKKN